MLQEPLGNWAISYCYKLLAHIKGYLGNTLYNIAIGLTRELFEEIFMSLQNIVCKSKAMEAMSNLFPCILHLLLAKTGRNNQYLLAILKRLNDISLVMHQYKKVI